MNIEHYTLTNLVGRAGFQLGVRTVWRQQRRGKMDYLAGDDAGTISCAKFVIREILSAHPGLKREAARWIRAGIESAKP